MMTTIRRTGDDLAELFRPLAEYRHAVFVEKLGWPLAVRDGLELDQFDGAGTRYLIGRDGNGAICGCARLLPTRGAYLLSDVFASLLDGAAPPHDDRVWELSRFAVTHPADAGRAIIDVDAATRAMLGASVRLAAECGAERLITVSPLGIERLLLRMGVDAHRAGRPQRIGGKPIFACWIELNRQTAEALHLAPPPGANRLPPPAERAVRPHLGARA
ncbi:acyl-homoserine-lactone synthase [Burkholderia plantarii]|uniref:Acyl-homoserine-lactone synthase n=1 Tax=Burkholderia plantarii TaxID=41899 RepID=A0A0B6S268_BURPL|nr:acyl-homoserine-lactone synthase [Burkholderia plantarii]AJK48489.1 acyl-homoserine-lactone synthase LasI [Burkholderia plantarii]